MAFIVQDNSKHREGSFDDGSIDGGGGDVCVATVAYEREVWTCFECVMVMGGG